MTWTCITGSIRASLKGSTTGKGGRQKFRPPSPISLPQGSGLSRVKRNWNQCIRTAISKPISKEISKVIVNHFRTVKPFQRISNLEGALSESRIWMACVQKGESARLTFRKANQKSALSEQLVWKARFQKEYECERRSFWEYNVKIDIERPAFWMSDTNTTTNISQAAPTSIEGNLTGALVWFEVMLKRFRWNSTRFRSLCVVSSAF